MTTTLSETLTSGNTLLPNLKNTLRQVSSRIGRFIVLAALTCFVLLSAMAQVATGDILGTVLDTSGATIPGAAVHLENAGTNEARN